MVPTTDFAQEQAVTSVIDTMYNMYGIRLDHGLMTSLYNNIYQQLTPSYYSVNQSFENYIPYYAPYYFHW